MGLNWRLKIRPLKRIALVSLRHLINIFDLQRVAKLMSDKLPDINHALHDARSARLRKLPPFFGTVLSAGCAGTWYFDWIAQQTGHTGRHIGIEFYGSKPTDLPANVEWIANTAGDMNSVGNESCDLVFSGQNLEHLWPEEVIGFFLESNRVLKPGGLLVVDSPNRLVTEPLTWSHPEHTVEVTPAEARKLAELSGFEVTALKGMWLCRDPGTGQLLPLDPRAIDPRYTYVERHMAAEDDPENSFLWWLEARKVAEPKPHDLKTEMNRIFTQAWPERTRRFVSLVGERIRKDNRDVISCPAGTAGVLIYGPYMPLKGGDYTATFNLRLTKSTEPGVVVRCDILGDKGREIVMRDLSQNEIESSDGLIGLDFKLANLEFGIQARCISYGRVGVECALPIDIVCKSGIE
jgi:SAM-dependent methyltransferase